VKSKSPVRVWASALEFAGVGVSGVSPRGSASATDTLRLTSSDWRLEALSWLIRIRINTALIDRTQAVRIIVNAMRIFKIPWGSVSSTVISELSL
jgi:hypothetical protein